MRTTGGALLPDQELEQLLEAFPDDDVEPLHVVELGAVPTDLLLEAKSHIDNLVREFTLEAAGRGRERRGRRRQRPVGAGPAGRDRGARLAGAAHRHQAPGARGGAARRARGAPHADAAASAADAGERYLAALDEADGGQPAHGCSPSRRRRCTRCSATGTCRRSSTSCGPAPTARRRRRSSRSRSASRRRSEPRPCRPCGGRRWHRASTTPGCSAPCRRRTW
jgi:hypothetical protein